MLKKLSACVFAMLAFFFMTSTAYAQEPSDRRTLFTFDQPVTLPGVTLPAGTYVFRLADATADRSVVQITSPDRTRVYATVLTRPIRRAEAAEDPDIRFIEAPAPMANVVHAWWYPGSHSGWEFVYPPDQATRIAEARRAASTPASPVNTDDHRR